MCINTEYACATAFYRNIQTDRVPNFQLTPEYINNGCSQSYQIILLND